MPEKTEGGFCWHQSEFTPFGWCPDFEKRLKNIKETAPQDICNRLIVLFKPVRGQIPEEVVRAKQLHLEAMQAYHKAREADEEAIQTHKGSITTHNMTWKAYQEAPPENKEILKQKYEKSKNDCFDAKERQQQTQQAHNKASKICIESVRNYKKVLAKHIETIEALHRKECPECPWNGRAIFSEVV
ncbi:MAG: hypothetical protein COV29_03575 [Candidatus Yanofskybacteria bacterium CG10_big_fil_rev_8_21_14_0_10_36_16]|uniref:F-BAR domain-containing protein n=1 Tax=Candidatus Yanofskybacteria bacterium CG10_big_fil_rev_8_21_14_0_10_36_16 TaxID=1975096 RepID=A0A2J0Q7F4_9BACT|nr:MAG: hypothetical protein COV29_03575 [Candidatus Yanofskybacteria bacterium CG10_big_fil_rev_8_21_14_0_10_36_16]